MSDTRRLRVWRATATDPPVADRDHLVVEAPLEIRVGGSAVCITMRTPGHDRELALGFLLAEGVIASRADVTTVRQAGGGPGRNVVDLAPAPGLEPNLAHLERHVVVSSACGLCGRTRLDALHRRLAPVAAGPTLDPALLLELPGRLATAQSAFAQTGGLHAAGIFDADGAPVVVREDVGRHNAVDKVLGWGVLHAALPWRQHVLVVSGRASFEIVQKALAAGIPVVAAISAPSTAAVALADDGHQTLVGFLRPPRLTIYTHPERVRAPG